MTNPPPDTPPDPRDRAAPVREGEALDGSALRAFLTDRFPGRSSGDPVVEQFPRGFSNLTYLIRWGGEEFILRRPPFGGVAGTAHDVIREARVLSALGRVYRQVPRVLADCEDAATLGAPFYLMERVRGIILRDRVPAGVSLGAGGMRHLSRTVVETLAAIHAVDYAAAGLADLGNPGGYVERQVAGWTKRYAAAATTPQPAVEEAAAWLATHRTPARGATLIHNDFKFDNLVLDAADPTRVLAVLDWEMVTVGDPLMDLGTSLAYWVERSDAPAIRSLGLGITASPGALTRAEVVEHYAAVSGRTVGDAVFYFVFGLFKVAVIAQQIHARWVRGFTSDPRFATLDEAVSALGAAATRAIETGRV